MIIDGKRKDQNGTPYDFVESRHPYSHEWYGQGAGQAGDSGYAVCRCGDDGIPRVARQGYRRRLAGGARGWQVDQYWDVGHGAGDGDD